MKPQFEDILNARIDEDSKDLRRKRLGRDVYTQGEDPELDQENAEERKAREAVDAHAIELKDQEAKKKTKRKARKIDPLVADAIANHGEDADHKEEDPISYTEEQALAYQEKNLNDKGNIAKRKAIAEKLKVDFDKAMERHRKRIEGLPDGALLDTIKQVNNYFQVRFPMDPSPENREAIINFITTSSEKTLRGRDRDLEAGITNGNRREDLGKRDYKQLRLIRFPMLQDGSTNPPQGQGKAWTLAEIVSAMYPIVQALAGKFMRNSKINIYGLHDLMQDGIMGVLNAIRKDAGISPFGQYAFGIAHQTMKKGLSKFDTMGRGSRFWSQKAQKQILGLELYDALKEVQDSAEEFGWDENKTEKMRQEAHTQFVASHQHHKNMIPALQDITGADGNTSVLAATFEENQNTAIMGRLVRDKNGTESILPNPPRGTQAKLPAGYTLVRNNDSPIVRITKVGVGAEEETFRSPEDISLALEKYFGKTVPAEVVAVLQTLEINTKDAELKEALEEAGIKATPSEIKHYNSANLGKAIQRAVKDTVKRGKTPLEYAMTNEDEDKGNKFIETLITRMKDPKLVGRQSILSMEQELVFRLMMEIENEDFLGDLMRKKFPKLTYKSSELESELEPGQEIGRVGRHGRPDMDYEAPDYKHKPMDGEVVEPPSKEYEEMIAAKVKETQEEIAQIDSAADVKGKKNSPSEWTNAPTRPMVKVGKIYRKLIGTKESSVHTLKYEMVVEKIIKVMNGPFMDKFSRSAKKAMEVSQEIEKTITAILEADGPLAVAYQSAQNDRERAVVMQKTMNKAYSMVASKLSMSRDDVLKIYKTAKIFSAMSIDPRALSSSKPTDSERIKRKARENAYDELLKYPNKIGAMLQQHADERKSEEESGRIGKSEEASEEEIRKEMIEKLGMAIPKGAMTAAIHKIKTDSRTPQDINKIRDMLGQGADIEDIAAETGLPIADIETLKALDPSASPKEIRAALDAGARQDADELRKYRLLIGKARDYAKDGWDDERIANILRIKPREATALRELRRTASLQEINAALDVATTAYSDLADHHTPLATQENIKRTVAIVEEIVFQTTLRGIEAGIGDEALINKLINGNE